MGYATMGYGDAIESGYNLGTRRAIQEFGLSVDPSQEALFTTSQSLHYVIERWPFELTEHFVRFMAENIGVAASARAANGYAALSRDQIIGFIGHSADIFDSLKHA